MKILVTGATGLIGSRLVQTLRSRGDEVLRVTRGPSRPPGTVHWDLDAQTLDCSLADVDGVVHLAGESIAGGRWTADKKQRLMDSRVRGTGLLASALAKEGKPGTPFISASAIGYYGDRGPEWLDERSPPGDLYLSEICVAWEAAAEPARDAGTRVVHPRIGVVLSRDGGALGAMLLPFQLGLGGPVGPGTQFLSWVSLEDVVNILVFCLDTPSLEGPVNATGPDPADNRGFTKALGQALHRPTVLPVPAFGIRALFGQMGEELLLASTRVAPRRLQEAGYVFRHPTLEKALDAALRTQNRAA